MHSPIVYVIELKTGDNIHNSTDMANNKKYVDFYKHQFLQIELNILWIK